MARASGPRTIAEYKAWLGSHGAKGGKARAKNMTAAERSEAARRAVQVRWRKAKKS